MKTTNAENDGKGSAAITEHMPDALLIERLQGLRAGLKYAYDRTDDGSPLEAHLHQELLDLNREINEVKDRFR